MVLLDSISYIGPAQRDQIVISGSHGGSAAARYALAEPPWLVLFNDAGVGKQQAGIVALAMLQAAGIAAAAVAHTSARIGDARDTWEHGIITHVNAAARALGLEAGQTVRAALAAL